MSSFVTDYVSESKKLELEQQVNEYQEKSTEITTDVTTATKNNNQIERITTTKETDDIKEEIKNNVGETNIENTKTINENKNGQIAKDSVVGKTIKTASAYDNESIKDDVIGVTIVDEYKSSNILDVTTSVDNSSNFNPNDENSLVTAQNIIPAAASLPLAACSSNIKLADVEQQQIQQKVFSDNQQIAKSFAINRSDNQTSDVTPILSSSPLKTDVNKLPMKDSDVSGSSSIILPVEAVVKNTSPLTSLPTGLVSSLAGSNLSHISSDPTCGVQLHNINSKGQQHNTNNSNTNRPIKVSIVASSAPASRSVISTSTLSCAIKSGAATASASPNMIRKSSDTSVLLPRRVSFPKSDSELVTGYLEPANPWEHVYMVKSISEIAELYIASCQKHNTKPLQSILDHLKAVDLTKQLRRQPLLSLKSIKLAPSDCEALEEVLKRT